MLYSIEMLDKVNIIQTMSNPILVHGDDLHFHYCKYNRFSGPAYRLFKEWLIASFIPHWGFYSTPVNFLQVRPEDIPNDLGINRRFFDAPCFALRESRQCTELDKQTVELLPKLASDSLKSDFLKLCFLDIWVANEDRSHNNYNILLIKGGKGYEVFPIDHEACFNHGEIRGSLIPITYEESLIYSEAFLKLFKPSDLIPAKVADKKGIYYLCRTACLNQLPAILSAIPPEWQMDMEEQQNILARFLFDDQWFEEAWETFLTYLHYYTGN